MPPLDDARDVTNPMAESSMDAVIDALLAGGIRSGGSQEERMLRGPSHAALTSSDRDVLILNEKEMANKCGLDPSAVLHLKSRFAEAYTAPMKTGRELLDGVSRTSVPLALKHWTFGCEGWEVRLWGARSWARRLNLSGPPESTPCWTAG